MQTAIPCVMMRGGTSKGAYFLSTDLPADTAARDRVLLAVMGSPDPRQIDGIGGADPLTSKVGIISKSSRPGIDVDYLFAQVFVDKALVSTAQNCGNILAGVGPFAIEQGLVRGSDGETPRARSTWSTATRPWLRPSRPPAACPPTRATRASTACRARRRRSRSPFPMRRAPCAARCCRRGARSTRSTASPRR